MKETWKLGALINGVSQGYSFHNSETDESLGVYEIVSHLNEMEDWNRGLVKTVSDHKDSGRFLKKLVIDFEEKFAIVETAIRELVEDEELNSDYANFTMEVTG